MMVLISIFIKKLMMNFDSFNFFLLVIIGLSVYHCSRDWPNDSFGAKSHTTTIDIGSVSAKKDKTCDLWHTCIIQIHSQVAESGEQSS